MSDEEGGTDVKTDNEIKSSDNNSTGCTSTSSTTRNSTSVSSTAIKSENEVISISSTSMFLNDNNNIPVRGGRGLNSPRRDNFKEETGDDATGSAHNTSAEEGDDDDDDDEITMDHSKSSDSTGTTSGTGGFTSESDDSDYDMIDVMSEDDDEKNAANQSNVKRRLTSVETMMSKRAKYLSGAADLNLHNRQEMHDPSRISLRQQHQARGPSSNRNIKSEDDAGRIKTGQPGVRKFDSFSANDHDDKSSERSTKSFGNSHVISMVLKEKFGFTVRKEEIRATMRRDVKSTCSDEAEEEDSSSPEEEEEESSACGESLSKGPTKGQPSVSSSSATANTIQSSSNASLQRVQRKGPVPLKPPVMSSECSDFGQSASTQATPRHLIVPLSPEKTRQPSKTALKRTRKKNPVPLKPQEVCYKQATLRQRRLASKSRTTGPPSTRRTPQRSRKKKRTVPSKAAPNEIKTTQPTVRCPCCCQWFPQELVDDHADQCAEENERKRSDKSLDSSSSKFKSDEDSACIASSLSSSHSGHHPGIAPVDGHDSHSAMDDDGESPDPSTISPTAAVEIPWRQEVEKALRQVRQETAASREELLRNMLLAKNKLLQQDESKMKQPLKYRRLPSVENGIIDSEYVHSEDHPLPRDSHHTIFLRKHFSSLGVDKDDVDAESLQNSDDESTSKKHRQGSSSRRSLKFVSPLKRSPMAQKIVIKCASSSDDDDDSEVKGVREDLSPSKKLFAKQITEFRLADRIGVGYEEDEMDAEIDKVLDRVKVLDHDRDAIHEYLAILLQEDVERVKRRWRKANGDGEPTRTHATRYEHVMSSFRDLFCRRCLTFDCNLHGLPDDYPPDVQMELALRLEKSGHWKEEEPMMCLPVLGSDSGTDSDDTPSLSPGNSVLTLSETQKELCKRLYKLFQKDLGKVSQVTRIPKSVICRQVVLEEFEFKINDAALVTGARQKQSTKSNNYHQEWIKRIEQATSHPFFNPCTHSEPCSEETCSCIQNRFFCTKACIWGGLSRNFFRGCNCNSKCTANYCPCFASNRECDPDLCKRCGTCSDPPNLPATKQKCRNDSVGMRRHAHLLLGKSKVAGWGLYTKYALKKGDYVHEYLGELVPHNEAERRGKVYDQRNQTYIFDMSTDYAVDALRKGNKTRFINHSDNPNIRPQMKVVNGDFRIGFFARKDIPAQTELFFDYGDKFFKASGGFSLHHLKKK